MLPLDAYKIRSARKLAYVEDPCVMKKHEEIETINAWVVTAMLKCKWMVDLTRSSQSQSTWDAKKSAQ